MKIKISIILFILLTLPMPCPAFTAMIFDAQNGLSGFDVKTLHYDGKYMYIGYESGLVDRYNYLYDRFDKTYEFNYPIKSINSSDDNIWIGLKSGIKLISRLTEQLALTPEFPELENKTVQNINISNDYVLAVCGESNYSARTGNFFLGRLRIGESSFKEYSSVNGLLIDDIYKGVIVYDDFYLASTGGLIEYNDAHSNFKIYSSADGFEQYQLFDICRERNKLYIGGAGIYYVFSLKEKKVVKSVKIGISTNDYINVIKVIDGNIWIGTNGSGLFFYNTTEKKWYIFPEGDYLYDNIIGIEQDKYSVWIVSERAGKTIITRIMLNEDGDKELPEGHHLDFDINYKLSIIEPFDKTKTIQDIVNLLNDSISKEDILNNLITGIENNDNTAITSLFEDVLWVGNTMVSSAQFIKQYLSNDSGNKLETSFIQPRKNWAAEYNSGRITYFAANHEPLLNIVLKSSSNINTNITKESVTNLKIYSLTIQNSKIKGLK